MTTATMSPAVSAPDARTRASGGVANVFVLAALIGFQAYAVAAGLPAWHCALALLGVLVTQVLPGALMWRSIRPRDGWLLEDLIMGFAMGVCVAVPAQIIAGLLHSRIPAIVLPLLVVAALLGTPLTRRRITEARWSPLPWWLGLGLALTTLGFLAQLVNYARTNRLSWSDGPGQPHIDTYLHLALASQLLERGPVNWPTVWDGTLGYQWFTHTWIAHVTAVSGVPLDEVLMRFMPALLPVAAVLSIAMLALRVSGSAVVALVAAAGSVFFSQGTPLATPGANLPLTPLSPTVGLAIPPLMAFIAVMAMRWRGQALRGAWLAVPLLTCISTGMKGSTSPIVVAGMALALVAMLLFNRSMVRPVLVDLIMIGVTLGLTVIVVYRGSASGLKLDPAGGAAETGLAAMLGGASTTKIQIVAALSAFGLGMTRALFAFALPFRREDRRDPLTWVLIGAALAGGAAVALFYHPGSSQYYFLMTAIPLGSIGSALGAWRLYHALQPRQRIAILAAGVVGGALFFTLPARLTGGTVHPHQLRHAVELILLGALIALLAGVVVFLVAGSRRLISAVAATAAVVLLAGPFAVLKTYEDGFPVQPIPAPVSLSADKATSNDQIAAAVFIRDHSGDDDLVMTNRHCTRPIVPDHCDNRRWVVTAFSQRQSFIEAWTATPESTNLEPNKRDSYTMNYWHPELLALNDGFYTAPSAAAQRQLWDRGVRWVYLDNTMPHASTLAPYATLRYSNADASAWQLNAPKN